MNRDQFARARFDDAIAARADPFLAGAEFSYRFYWPEHNVMQQLL